MRIGLAVARAAIAGATLLDARAEIGVGEGPDDSADRSDSERRERKQRRRCRNDEGTGNLRERSQGGNAAREARGVGAKAEDRARVLSVTRADLGSPRIGRCRGKSADKGGGSDEMRLRKKEREQRGGGRDAAVCKHLPRIAWALFIDVADSLGMRVR